MRLFYKDACRFKYLTGYGSFSRNFLYRLWKTHNIDLFVQTSSTAWHNIEQSYLPVLTTLPRIQKKEKWDLILHVCQPLSLQGYEGQVNLAYSMCEHTVLPQEWIDKLSQMQKLLVPSKWNKKVYEDNGLDNIAVVPGGVNTDIFHPRYDADICKEVHGFFRVLINGDFGFRKGQDIAVRAFCRWAKGDKKKQLYIKADKRARNHIRRIVAEECNHCNIVVDDRVLSPEEMSDLYNTAHVLLCTARGEGWCLPVIEAMACKLPVISPIGSGMSEYLTPKNCFPIEYENRQVESYSKTDPYVFGWTNKYPSKSVVHECNIESTVNHLETIGKDYDKALKVARQGWLDIRENYTWDISTEKLNKELIDFNNMVSLV